MKVAVKSFIKRHPLLLKTAKSIRHIIRPPDVSLREFRSFANAERDIDEWIKTFPERYDFVIGIPRSGLYIASYIAVKLGLPLSTPDNFMRGEVWFSSAVEAPKLRRALLVDDGVGRVNGQLSQNFEMLSRAFPDIKITKGALYSYPDVLKATDLCFGFLEARRRNREEWNIMHRKFGELTASDLDGVLCHDWDPDHYRSYSNFIEEAEPYLIPRFKVDFVITSRAENYREATLEWLHRHEVKFGTLIMKENSHVGFADSARYKARWLKKYKPNWYWESDLSEAVEINRLSGIPVLCTENMKLLTKEPQTLQSVMR